MVIVASEVSEVYVPLVVYDRRGVMREGRVWGLGLDGWIDGWWFVVLWSVGLWVVGLRVL